jgi:hypothetical protein
MTRFGIWSRRTQTKNIDSDERGEDFKNNKKKQSNHPTQKKSKQQE